MSMTCWLSSEASKPQNRTFLGAVVEAFAAKLLHGFVRFSCGSRGALMLTYWLLCGAAGCPRTAAAASPQGGRWSGYGYPDEEESRASPGIIAGLLMLCSLKQYLMRSSDKEVVPQAECLQGSYLTPEYLIPPPWPGKAEHTKKRKHLCTNLGDSDVFGVSSCRRLRLFSGGCLEVVPFHQSVPRIQNLHRLSGHWIATIRL